MDEVQLHRVALRVRREVVSFNATRSRPFAAPHLGGGCAVASWTVCAALTLLGVQNQFVVGFYGKVWDGDHCWTEVIDDDPTAPPSSLVLDVTATQFGLRPLVVCAAPNTPLQALYHPLHRGDRALQEVNTRRWKNQAPVRYEKTLRAIAEKVVMAESVA